MMRNLGKWMAATGLALGGFAMPSLAQQVPGQQSFQGQPAQGQQRTGQPQTAQQFAAQQQAAQQFAAQQQAAAQQAAAQQRAMGQQAQGQPMAGHSVAGQPNAGQMQPAASAPVTAPFTLTPQEQAALDQILLAWEQQSNGTKRLESKFRRWHFDLLAAPAGVHATWASGVLKYASPDKGLFRVDQLKFFNGIVEGKPTYIENPEEFGEHWVCDGTKLLEFNRSKKECRIQQLPPELRGKEIFESPLPFVFNLNAAKIKERYWIRQIEAPEGAVAVEAFPKFQSDRAQYKFVRIVINAQTFLPKALILYGPNFHPETAPAYDHYEFQDVERNTIAQGLAAWTGVFFKERPPADWTVIEDVYRPEPQAQPQMAQPGNGATIR